MPRAKSVFCFGGVLLSRSDAKLDIIQGMKSEPTNQLIVVNLEGEVVLGLKVRAASNGQSADSEHREALSEALLSAGSKTSLKELLLAMPDVGEDSDFERERTGVACHNPFLESVE